jgi:hypothetical protein
VNLVHVLKEPLRRFGAMGLTFRTSSPGWPSVTISDKSLTSFSSRMSRASVVIVPGGCASARQDGRREVGD